jgi:hypothetical protein
MHEAGSHSVPVPGAAAVSPPSQSLASLSSLIGRIIETVDAETKAIRSDAGFDIKSSNVRKSRYLYELNRAVASLGGEGLPQEHRGLVLRLREKLAANEAAIKAHLSAVGEVASIIQDAIQRSETDGTYTESQFGAARG